MLAEVTRVRTRLVCGLANINDLPTLLTTVQSGEKLVCAYIWTYKKLCVDRAGVIYQINKRLVDLV